jgi:hypothetical protein
MNRMAPHPLVCSAFVYVRQSSPNQLTTNPESRRRPIQLTRASTYLAELNLRFASRQGAK